MSDISNYFTVREIRNGPTNKDRGTTTHNQSLRENYKVKEDALAHLSDQLLVLRERIQQLERK